MALMKDLNGEEHDIVPDGVEALESLGWARVDVTETATSSDSKPATRRPTRSRPKSE